MRRLAFQGRVALTINTISFVYVVFLFLALHCWRVQALFSFISATGACLGAPRPHNLASFPHVVVRRGWSAKRVADASGCQLSRRRQIVNTTLIGQVKLLDVGEITWCNMVNHGNEAHVSRLSHARSMTLGNQTEPMAWHSHAALYSHDSIHPLTFASPPKATTNGPRPCQPKGRTTFVCHTLKGLHCGNACSELFQLVHRWGGRCCYASSCSSNALLRHVVSSLNLPSFSRAFFYSDYDINTHSLAVHGSVT